MNKKEKAIFAAGCFWSVQDSFDNLNGVLKTTVGYTGGKNKNPSYEDVCSGDTGHAEAVEVLFDSEKISYEELLQTFFSIHDSTQLNRQGPDVGEQYRSAIFFTTEEQKELAKKFISKIQKENKNKIVTKLEKASTFYPAEEYHQHYNKKNGRSCFV